MYNQNGRKITQPTPEGQLSQQRRPRVFVRRCELSLENTLQYLHSSAGGVNLMCTMWSLGIFPLRFLDSKHLEVKAMQSFCISMLMDTWYIHMHVNARVQVNCLHEYQCSKQACSEQSVNVLYLELALFSSNPFRSWTPVWDALCPPVPVQTERDCGQPLWARGLALPQSDTHRQLGPRHILTGTRL